ncbi:hypothetical protein F443_01795, partial [Phytophthora nicotianae P1569]
MELDEEAKEDFDEHGLCGEDFDGQIEAVNSNIIGSKTATMYLRGMSRYIAWLYTNKRDVLSGELLSALRDDALEDDGTGYLSLKVNGVLRFIRENAKCRNGGKPGISVYNSLRSALFHLYRGCGRSMDVDFAADVTLFFKGLKRETAKRNHDSGEKLTEGKDPLPFSMLRSLSVSMMEHESDEFVFAHFFLVITWKLMCRAGNTASIHAGHLSWEGDALAVRFGHMKNDQDGTRPRDARHVYVNPFHPEICPILSLGIYAAVCGLDDSKLFPGGNQYDQFSKILKRLLTEPTLSNLLDTEGLSPADTGTQFIRKGSA